MRTKLFQLLAVLALGLLAGCGGIQMQDGVLTIDINLPETQINELVSRAARSDATTSEDVLFDSVTSIELIEPDLIRVFGEGESAGVPYEGNYDIRVGAESGALRLAITDVAVPGISLDDPRVVEANTRLQESFTQQVSNEGGQGVVQSASIENNALRLVIVADLNQ